MKTEKVRCPWCNKDELYQRYHDEEWGRPVHDDQALFELLNLEGAQAGLSWYTVLTKRENYRQAFDNWNAEKIARYSDKKRAELMQNAGIIRNRLKIQAATLNAKAYLEIKKEGSFNDYIWQFVNHKPIINQFETMAEIQPSTAESDAMSKDLKKRGFKFVGTTICYAFMQASGMVNDHLLSCWTRNQKRTK